MTDMVVGSVAAWCTSSRILLLNNMVTGDMGYKDGSWMVLANDPVRWWALV